MGFFDSVKRLFGSRVEPFTRCGYCGHQYRSPTRWCVFCHNGKNLDVIAASGFSAPPPLPELSQPVEPTGLQGLDSSRFEPLTTKEAHATIRSFGGVRSAYLDSMGEIPDPNLPRIQVIDRTMVGAGLISADELAEIHELGSQFQRFRSDEAILHRKAEAAVQASREEREALKVAKKAEAAERKKRRAEEVARRKATDIIYLGRGVSAGLADRRANVEKLESYGVPSLATPANVAAAMGLSIGRLRFLSFHSEAPTRIHYVQFDVPKKSGGVRTLSSPHKSMAEAQRWVLTEVLEKLEFHNAAHGFVRGRSTVTNAEPHVGADIVVNADLADFFPSITFPRVRGAFKALGYSPAAATIFALLTTESPRRALRYAAVIRFASTGPRALPQGACTSPALSNWIAWSLDRRLAGIANKLGWTYTRYADDVTFSASGEDKNGQVGYLLARLRHIAQDEGFQVNEAKTRVQRRSTRQSVTGLVVNDALGVPRPLVRRVRSILHRAKTEGLAAQNRDEHENFEDWLSGMIAYIEMVKPERGTEFRRQLDALQN